ncbi:uncharacterized protein LOC132592592 isoform X1 [Zootoca vivipara]|uniref:uncharacterized protein LOC132592592 isoform X1 n=1 Tax=Zootoca vivipara TaxID=8524 RepID=UPI00293BD0DB|nr:uncharacterized protein LOC132592592 isoform X1 [Zootoca vivipara]
MPVELTALHSEQIQTSAEMEKTVTLLEKGTIEVSDAKEQLVGADEKEANEVAALAKVIQEQCEGDLAEAMPALEAALLAPDMLNPANTSFLKVQSERKKGITQKKEHGNNPEVAVMPKELTALHPEQIQTSAEMEKTVTLLEKETIEVSDAKEELVGADEKEANEVAALAKVIQEQCEGDLAEAMPALEAALLAPNMLNPANTSFLKVQSEHKKGITQKKEHGNNPEVAVMPMELTALHPEQIQTSAEMEKTVTLLEKGTIEVSDAKEKLVGADEKEANEVAALAKVIQEQCEGDLAEAMPALEAALLALDMLNPANTSFLKVQSERKKGITQKKEHGNNPEVAVMPMELTALHSEQIQTSAEMEKTVTLLEKETIEVSDAKEQLVGADEKEANEVAALAKVIQEQCEGDLAEAMPALKTALLAPDMLNPANTSFLKVQSERKKGITQKKEHGNNPEVAVMPMELTALHPEQIQTSAEMEKTVPLLEKETIEVSDAKEQLVGADEKEANEVAALAQGIQVIVLCSMVAPLHPLRCHLT